MTPTDDEIHDLLNKASERLGTVCRDQSFRLHVAIPARPGIDDDLVIMDGIEAGMKAAEEVLRLRAEVAKMRALLVDLDLWDIGHKMLCGVKEKTPCDCGADDLQLRLNEVTT